MILIREGVKLSIKKKMLKISEKIIKDWGNFNFTKRKLRKSV